MNATTIKEKEGKYYLIEVDFNYDESCHNVYKHFSVSINHKGTNIKGLIKFIPESEIPKICTQNTYFWTPGRNAASRRRNEERHINEFEAFADKFFDGINNKMITSELGFDGDFYILNNSGKYYLGTNDLNKVEKKINELRSNLIEQEAQMAQ